MEKPSRGINYLYFGLYFALMILLSASSTLLKSNLSGSRMFFFLYAAGQVAFETAGLIFLGFYIRRFLKEKFFCFYIGATFLLLLLHVLDFMMDRVLDLSIWETISCFILHDDLRNLFFLLDASGIPLWAWGIALGCAAFFPLLGVVLYRLSEACTNRKPWHFSPEKFLVAFVCLPAGLLLWDISASRIIHPDAYTEFLQSLPWKTTFLEPKTVTLPLTGSLRKSPSEQQISTAIMQETTPLLQKPNIYLFIVESLRKDMLTAEIAPHLHAWAQTLPVSDTTLSNANGTNLAWFSIFHSQFAYHWDRLKRQGWNLGSPPLALLKQLGYQIHVYTSAQLGYYGLEPLLFGSDNHLLASYHTFHHPPPLKAADGDLAAITQLHQDIGQNPSWQEGQMFVVFLDSTHFDYSWSDHWPPKFTPFASELSFFRAFYSQERIELIKNRYRNAVSYVDSLLGQFLSYLPHPEEAMVIVTGDHGEEFFEHGHLFHNSHLTREQTLIPLLMKFGTKQSQMRKHIVSQIDIFPSLIDALTGKTFSFLEGSSIFREEKWPYTLTSRFNGSRNPYEFFLHNGKYKLIARFSHRSDIFQADSIQIRSVRTADDQTIFALPSEITTWIQKEFQPALNRLCLGCDRASVDAKGRK